MSDIVSRPYNPSAEMCCMKCAFGEGWHARWCEKNILRSLEIIDELLAEETEEEVRSREEW